MLSWGELASFRLGFWQQDAIESNLSSDRADAIPQLIRLADLKVGIPLEILALERLADRDGSRSTPSSRV